MDVKGLNKDILLNRNKWQRIIHVINLCNSLLVHVSYPKYLDKRLCCCLESVS